MTTVQLEAQFPQYQSTELVDPHRLEVKELNGNWVATFTFDAYTVTLAGPARSFSESAATHSVSHSTWVRTLPSPFDGQVNQAWLDLALEANRQGATDILTISTQYIQNAVPIFDGDLQIAGDASYGPLQEDGKRQEGSDFNDYLGLPWTYPDSSVDKPESKQRFCLDCSGYMRMIWGYRHHLPHTGYRSGVPLSRAPTPDQSALPRQAWQMVDFGPGVIIVSNQGVQATDFSKLDIGDLVFFDVDRSQPDGPRIDHVGMYLGQDSAGLRRFISSRKSSDGPTMGDTAAGMSVLDKPGELYPKRFRAVRRL